LSEIDSVVKRPRTDDVIKNVEEKLKERELADDAPARGWIEMLVLYLSALPLCKREMGLQRTLRRSLK